MKQIPNLFTLLNLFFGCLAIIVTLQSGITLVTTEEGKQLMNMPEAIYLASLFLLLAGVVDFFDGFLARALKASSAMGKQLDSLADVVSFGVAPGLIIYQFLRLAVAHDENGLDASIVWLLPALILPCASAYRLAKFNIDETQSYSFKGVPTPAAGLLVASFPVIFWHTSNETVLNLFFNKWVWYTVVVALSWLMVSNVPIMSLKMKDYKPGNNLPQLFLLIISVLLILFFRWSSVPLIFLAYIILSLLFKNKIA
ncbi:MAG: CDP-alcohol phosphatidyltransferase [Bacteroidetes bacterium]|nr:MAG: CDP-alcohol phosphatidyltransferase [Bacteroidota bacterium]